MVYPWTNHELSMNQAWSLLLIIQSCATLLIRSLKWVRRLWAPAQLLDSLCCCAASRRAIGFAAVCPRGSTVSRARWDVLCGATMADCQTWQHRYVGQYQSTNYSNGIITNTTRENTSHVGCFSFVHMDVMPSKSRGQSRSVNLATSLWSYNLDV